MSVLSFLFCFGTAWFALGGTPTAPPPTLTPTPTATPSTEISILLIGVDSLANPRPQMEACWILRYPRNTPPFYLTGFSPLTQVQLNPGKPPQSLKEIYADDRYIRVGDSMFTRNAIQSILPGLTRPQGEVVYDRGMLVSAINLLGGIQINGQLLRGNQVLALYDFIPLEDAQARMDFQVAIVRALTEAAKQTDWSDPTLQAFLSLGQQWTPDLAWFKLLAQAELPITDDEFIATAAPLATPTSVAPTP